MFCVPLRCLLDCRFAKTMNKPFLVRLLFVAFLAFALFRAAEAQSTPADDCNARSRDAIAHVSLPGHPFGSAVTKDGCWIFVSLVGDRQRSNGVAMLRRSGGKVKLEKVFTLEARPTELVLTRDSKLLIIAALSDVIFLDVEKMLAKNGDPVLGAIHQGDSAGSIQVNVTSDDKFLFVSEERAQSITVIDLKKAVAEKFGSSSIIGRIHTGLAPIALVFSPDEKLLYTTSEVGPQKESWPVDCNPENPARSGGPPNPEGLVEVVDVERAKTQPDKSVIAVVPAKCSPVRMAMSPRGDYVYVTARNSNAMLVFDTSKLAHNSKDALVAEVPVGSAPVPIAVVDSGKRILVGNSNRFAGKTDNQDVLVIDATKVSSGKAAIVGKIPAGGFPREFSASPDGQTLFLSNFGTDTLEIIDVARLPGKSD